MERSELERLAAAESIATRDDPDNDAQQQAIFVGPPGRRLLCMLQLPRRAARAGVVICSPLGAEQVQNHGRELALARELTSRGLGVIRFHYRCTGDSDGHSHALTFESMVDDVFEAVRCLTERAGVARFAVIGTRLGGLVAAAAARAYSTAPLALWEPVADTRRYFDSIARYQAIQDTLHPSDAVTAAGSSLKAQIEASGTADLLGFPLTDALFTAVRERSIVRDLEGAPRSVLLVQLRRKRSLVAEYERLQESLVADGHRFSSRQIRCRIAWWFLARDSSSEVADAELIATTADWLTTELAAEEKNPL